MSENDTAVEQCGNKHSRSNLPSEKVNSVKQAWRAVYSDSASQIRCNVNFDLLSVPAFGRSLNEGLDQFRNGPRRESQLASHCGAKIQLTLIDLSIHQHHEDDIQELENALFGIRGDRELDVAGISDNLLQFDGANAVPVTYGGQQSLLLFVDMAVRRHNDESIHDGSFLFFLGPSFEHSNNPFPFKSLAIQKHTHSHSQSAFLDVKYADPPAWCQAISCTSEQECKRWQGWAGHANLGPEGVKRELERMTSRSDGPPPLPREKG